MNAALDDDVTLVRPSWARLKRCPVREQWLLLVPERVLFPCPTTVELLERLTVPTRLGSLVGELAREYDAPEEVIRTDVVDLLSGLVEKGYVRRIDA
jgi:pyrroloquinoline quinone biosynthesis protein D